MTERLIHFGNKKGTLCNNKAKVPLITLDPTTITCKACAGKYLHIPEQYINITNMSQAQGKRFLTQILAARETAREIAEAHRVKQEEWWRERNEKLDDMRQKLAAEFGADNVREDYNTPYVEMNDRHIEYDFVGKRTERPVYKPLAKALDEDDPALQQQARKMQKMVKAVKERPVAELPAEQLRTMQQDLELELDRRRLREQLSKGVTS